MISDASNSVLGITLRLRILILLSICSPTLSKWFRRSMETSMFLILMTTDMSEATNTTDIMYPSRKKRPKPVARPVIMVIINNIAIK